MAGAIWNPLAPAPIMATRLPAKSTEWSQRAEWNAGPAKLSRPGRSGMCGRFSCPTAEMTARATSVSSLPALERTRTDQVASSSFHVAPRTSVSKRMCGSMPCLTMTSWK